MTTPLGITGWRTYFVWGTLLVYVIARICQVYADRLPTLLIVVLHVVPPALFALVHGSSLYRPRGISIFAAFCLGFGTLAGSVSLRTGFPFGHYYFADGWNGDRVRKVLAHYDEQPQDEALAEDEFGVASSETVMNIPHDLVSQVRELIAKRTGQFANQCAGKRLT
jgi:hypothetical protein